MIVGASAVLGATGCGAAGSSSNQPSSSAAASQQQSAVRSGKVRWVLADSGGGLGVGNDGRVGSTTVMAAVQETCSPVSSVSGLFDCAGRADALAAEA